MTKLTFVKKVWTENTGGNVMVDFIELHDGTIISIGTYEITIAEDMERWNNAQYITIAKSLYDKYI